MSHEAGRYAIPAPDAGTHHTTEQVQRTADEAYAEGFAAGQAAGKPKKTKSKSTVLDCPAGVSPQTWADFLALRTKKQAPLTATALKLIEKAAAESNYTLEDALQTCCARGWAAFRSDWVTPKKPVGNLSNRSYGSNGIDNDGFIA